jgi:hypothetical protein
VGEEVSVGLESSADDFNKSGTALIGHQPKPMAFVSDTLRR